MTKKFAGCFGHSITRVFLRHSSFVIVFSLASLPRVRLGFLGENARAFGKHRHTLRLGAFEDKRDKAHRERA
jgi:hypothetical protein